MASCRFWLFAVPLTLLGCTDGTGPGKLRTRWLEPQTRYAGARPAVADGIVYMGGDGTDGGHIWARAVRTGDVKWFARIGPQRVGGANLLVSDGVLVVPAVSYTVGIDVATAGELWRYTSPVDTVGGNSSPGQVTRSTIAADSATVYIPAWGASVSAVDLQTGVARWVWQPDRSSSDTALRGRFRSGAEGVTLAGDTLYVAVWHFLDRQGLSSEPWLVALDARTGTELWKIVIPAFSSGVTVDGAPVVFGRLVIFAPKGGHTWAFDRFTRALVWRHVSTPYHSTHTGPELYGDAVYVDVGDDSVVALGAEDGVVRWKAHIGADATFSMLVTDRAVYVPYGQRLAILNRRTGRRLADVTQPGQTYDSYIASAPAAFDGQIFINVKNAAWSFDEP